MSICLRSPDDMIAWLCDGRDPMQASISIAKLAALISKALVTDGLEPDDTVVLSILLDPLGYDDELAHKADVIITAGDVYRHGSDWIVSLAEHFGFTGETDDAVDTGWLDSRPHMQAVWRAITRIGVGAACAAADAYEAQNGHSMMEVFLASSETGESFDQSQARLTAQRRGLHPVK